MSEEPGLVTTEAEGTGETVGEAKWSALRELERRFPGLDKANVRFAVLSEGERGLLGVGYAPARVLASLSELPAPPAGGPAADEEPDSGSARLRELLERICRGLDLPVSVAVVESETDLVATLSGPDLGLLIGKRGQTLDAIQYLANAILFRHGAAEEERKDLVVDAAGYRARRREALERLSERAARDAIRTASAVELEPMTAVERKIVHVFLKELGGVETASEGTEPNRHIVVSPSGD